MNKQYPILDSLTIKRCNRWKGTLEDPIKYEGEVEFMGESGSTTLHLDDKISRELINVVSNQLVASSKALANKLATEFITGDALLAPPADTEEVPEEL
jgi:hypothetical protein